MSDHDIRKCVIHGDHITWNRYAKKFKDDAVLHPEREWSIVLSDDNSCLLTWQVPWIKPGRGPDGTKDGCSGRFSHDVNVCFNVLIQQVQRCLLAANVWQCQTCLERIKLWKKGQVFTGRPSSSMDKNHLTSAEQPWLH